MNRPDTNLTIVERQRRAKRLLGSDELVAPAHGYFAICLRLISDRKLDFAPTQDRETAPRVRINLRPYQREVFEDRSSGILILHWSRQIGKSFTLAAWAVDRLLTRPGRLVTVLSNSRENGAEFVAKCAEVCRLNGTEYTSVDKSRGLRFQNMRMEVRIRAQGKTGRIKVLAANPRTARGFSGDLILDEFAFHEDSAAIWEAAEPILASNPDFLCRMASTGNGRHNLFYRMVEGAKNGDLEGKHRTSNAEHRTSNGEGLKTDVFSYGEGKMNDGTGGLKTDVFSYAPMGSKDEDDPPSLGSYGGARDEDERKNRIWRSRAGYAVSRITRTQAHGMGVKIYDANTRVAVSPEEAREQALDKRAYDQNYECVFADENATLLSHELINAAEVLPDGHPVGVICEQDWGISVRAGWDAGNPLTPALSPSDGERGMRRPVQDNSDAYGRSNNAPNRSSALQGLRNAVGPLYVGFDVARKGDLSVITVMEELNGMKMVRAILRMRDLRLPEQQQRLGEICRLPKFRRAAIDMTGLGLGLFEYAQEEFGASRIHGINFATSVPATRAVRIEGRKREMVRVTEAMAMELLQVYEDRRIQHPADNRLRDDLRKPEKITTPGGRVSIAATRDEAGHADHFWSFALALEAASHGGTGKVAIQVIPRPRRYLL